MTFQGSGSAFWRQRRTNIDRKIAPKMEYLNSVCLCFENRAQDAPKTRSGRLAKRSQDVPRRTQDPCCLGPKQQVANPSCLATCCLGPTQKKGPSGPQTAGCQPAVWQPAAWAPPKKKGIQWTPNSRLPTSCLATCCLGPMYICICIYIHIYI